MRSSKKKVRLTNLIKSDGKANDMGSFESKASGIQLTDS